MLIYKKCSEVSLNDIVTAFNTGFSDYIIKLQMTSEILTSRFLTVEQNQLENSYIVFDDEKPVGLMLGGIKEYEGTKTLRCGALCIDPSYRQMGVASKLFELHKQLAIENGCQRLYLEVIQDNQKAINFYLKQGYEILSEIEYYTHLNPQAIIVTKLDEHYIQKVSLEELKIIHSKNQIHLNWQNDFDYMSFFSQLETFKMTINEEIIGIVAILLIGKIFFIWIDPRYRKLGYGKALLNYVVKQFNMSKLSISFPKNEEMIYFLKKSGFTKDAISQYEMQFIID